MSIRNLLYFQVNIGKAKTAEIIKILTRFGFYLDFDVAVIIMSVENISRYILKPMV
jgi:hypothetical protein